MRWLPLLLLAACGGSSDTPETSAGGEATPEAAPVEAAPSERPAVAAVRTLLAFQAGPDDTPPAELGAAMDEVASAIEEDGSRFVEMLHAQAQALRDREVSERDLREMVDMAIDILWQLMRARAELGPDPAACDIGRAMALQGFEVWRAELSARLAGEGLAIEAADYGDTSETYAGCDEQYTDQSEIEDCFYRWTVTRAHWIAFGEDGPLAKVQAGVEAGPAETAAAIEAHLEDTQPLFQLLSSPRPQRPQVAELATLCAG